jgi:outer membrane protein assembly factor BamB
LAGTQTPWVAGEYIYLVTTSAEVVALKRDGGGIHWVRALARYGDAARRRDPIQWYGPVLAGDRLLLGSSQGQVVALSPYTGNVLGSFRVSGGVAVPPVVADGTLYIVTDNATIYALR